MIGDRGFEILWKVYSRELPIQLPTLLSKSSFSDSSDDEYDTDGMDEDSDGIEAIYRELRGSKESVSSANTTPTKQDAGEKFQLPRLAIYLTVLDLKRSLYSMTSSQSSAATDLHGLRSIPYLVFSNTGITDSTALFLSYILPIHPTPERLMPHFAPPKTGAQAETMEAYYTLGCRGIVYRTNNSLSNLSNRVLECAEGLREGRPVELLVPEESPFKPPFTPRRRRDSTAYGMPGSSLPELERARSKIQGALLREKGPHCISLWRVALRVLVVSREILFDPNAGPYENHRRTFRRQQGGHMSPMSPTGSAYSPAQLSHHSPLLHPQLHHSPHHSPQLHHSPVQLWKSHSPPRPPVGKFSVLAGNWPVISQYHHHPTSDTVVTPKRRLDCPISFEHLDLKENDPPVATAREDRRTVISAEPLYPGGLPAAIWKFIIVMASDPDGLLSPKQRSNLFDWAKTRDTVERERELSGKLRSLQIWRILEGTECLAYETL